MKVVIDTNVIISAILKNRTPEQIILFIAEQNESEWLVSSDILTEYKAVIHRPKFGSDLDVVVKAQCFVSWAL